MGKDIFPVLFSFLALLLYAISYFFKQKHLYLTFQGFGTLSLVISYLFLANYFAMISLFVGIIRIVTYYLIEKRGRRVPVAVVALFCAITIANYYLVNVLILHTSRQADIILMVSYCLYAIVLGIRNLMLVRYAMTVPLALSILYNVLIHAPVFTVISYSVELTVTIVTIVYFTYFDREKNYHGG